MKKAILLITVLTMSVNFAMGQASINLKGGVNGVYNVGETDFGTITSDFFSDPGYLVGLEYQAKLFSIVGFRGEANYVNGKFSYERERTTGSVPSLPNFDGNFDVTEVMNVVTNGIQIPTSIVLDLGPIDVNVGPSFEYLFSSIASGTLSATNLDSLSQAIPDTEIDYDFFNDAAGQGAYFAETLKDGNLFNAFNVGINLGVGVKLGKIRLDVKTNYALTDAINDYYQSTEGAVVDRPINVQVSAVYTLFSLGNKDKNGDVIEDEDEAVDVLYGIRN